MQGFNKDGFAQYGQPAPVAAQHCAHVLDYQTGRADAAIKAFYSRSSTQISADLVAAADDNRARGWSND